MKRLLAILILSLAASAPAFEYFALTTFADGTLYKSTNFFLANSNAINAVIRHPELTNVTATAINTNYFAFRTNGDVYGPFRVHGIQTNSQSIVWETDGGGSVGSALSNRPLALYARSLLAVGNTNYVGPTNGYIYDLSASNLHTTALTIESNLFMQAGAGAGKILVSDNSGHLTLQEPTNAIPSLTNQVLVTTNITGTTTTNIVLAGVSSWQVAQAMGAFDGSGTIIYSHGVNSVTRSAAGVYLVILTASANSTNYVVLPSMAVGTSIASRPYAYATNQTATQFEIRTSINQGAADSGCSFIMVPND